MISPVLQWFHFLDFTHPRRVRATRFDIARLIEAAKACGNAATVAATARKLSKRVTPPPRLVPSIAGHSRP
jgi:hypothetical protein